MDNASKQGSELEQTKARLIRAETCMFMIKLPQYSSLDVTLERLRQAMSCRDDPLIG